MTSRMKRTSAKKKPKTNTESPSKPRVDHHKNGSVRAKGRTRGGKLDGYWGWFRLDGSIMRSGHFAAGKQTGEWTTYDAKGRVVKVTRF